MRPLFLLALALPACTTLGDRASGGCPTGQTCSNETPYGLEFSASDFGDDWLADPAVKPLARGGTETISAWDHGTGDALAVPYAAQFIGGRMTVAGTSGNQIQATTTAITADELELRDSQAALLDKVAIFSYGIDQIGLTQGGTDLDYRENGAPIAFYPGANVRVTVTLTDSLGERLVDDHMTIAADGATLASWDSFDIIVPADRVVAQVTAGDRAPITLTAPATAAIDAVDADPWFSDAPQAGSSQLICFHAHAGNYEVVGTPWQVTIDGPAHVDADTTWFHNCVDVVMDDVGAVTVTGAIGDLAATTSFTVVPAQQAAAIARPTRGTATLGERALTPAE